MTENIFAATDHVGATQEIAFNVVESMIVVYLRVRSFSCVKNICIDKKKKKDAINKEKALRKSLKNKDRK